MIPNDIMLNQSLVKYEYPIKWLIKRKNKTNKKSKVYLITDFNRKKKEPIIVCSSLKTVIGKIILTRTTTKTITVMHRTKLISNNSFWFTKMAGCLKIGKHHAPHK